VYKENYITKNGHIYTGERNQQDEAHGRGEIIQKDGSFCEGYFQNGDLVRGRDFMTDWWYDGEWQDGEWHGQGTYIWNDGRKYVGSFVDGKFEGIGKFTMPDGKEYDGEYQNDHRHGVGMTTFPNGKKQRERWENGELIEVLEELN